MLRNHVSGYLPDLQTLIFDRRQVPMSLVIGTETRVPPPQPLLRIDFEQGPLRLYGVMATESENLVYPVRTNLVSIFFEVPRGCMALF